jgi:hypothetical protein
VLQAVSKKSIHRLRCGNGTQILGRYLTLGGTVEGLAGKGECHGMMGGNIVNAYETVRLRGFGLAAGRGDLLWRYLLSFDDLQFCENSAEAEFQSGEPLLPYRFR